MHRPFTRRTILFAVIGLLVCAAVARSQNSQTTLSVWTILQQLSVRVDNLQARLDATAGPPASAQSLDVATATTSGGEHYLEAAGWAFSCGPDPVVNFGGSFLVVDDLELPLMPVARVERPDVTAAYAGFCPGAYVPTRSGVSYMVPLALFGSGPSENNWHAVKLRTYDTQGRMSETAYTFVHAP